MRPPIENLGRSTDAADLDGWEPRPRWTDTTDQGLADGYIDQNVPLLDRQAPTLDPWEEYEAEIDRERHARLQALMSAETTTWATVLERWARERPSWMRQADCRAYHPADFHPQRGQDTRPLKAICAGCPVRQDCLNYALDNNIKHGIWGGHSERERRRARKERRQVA